MIIEKEEYKTCPEIYKFCMWFNWTIEPIKEHLLKPAKEWEPIQVSNFM